MGGSSSRPLTTSLKHCTLWKADRSPACRAVLMALDAMNIDVHEVDVNMDKEEHKSPEILSMNPLQTLPILKDRDLIISDSQAITTYLASRYCTEMSKFLLPPGPSSRALVDQFLHFNSSVLYPQYKAASNPILHGTLRIVDEKTNDEIQCAYADMERMLAKRAWFSSGNWPSLGDISLAATVSTLDVLVPIDVSNFPKLSCWLHRMAEEKFFCTANKKGLSEFKRRIECGNCFNHNESKYPRNSEDRRNNISTTEPTTT
ncbi:glutathione S-transferase 1-like [Cydia amplana]|uniref:glutathione S-transferase 1-like n=1 Tax=Cydia amplana TaxID=1869771 RepID=UPI002FE6C3CD